MGVDTPEDAERQIAAASRYIERVAPNPGSRLFAYPYGDVPEYLLREYLPSMGESVGVRAAFGTADRYLTAATSRWSIPRFVCGSSWHNEAQFAALVDGL